MKTYIDTSVLVAALTRESTTIRVQAWLALQPSGSLLASEWVAAEFSAALSIKLRTGDVEQPFRSRTPSRFHRLAADDFEIVDVERDHFQSAARLADRYELGLRAGDALHLAIAKSRGAIIATLDRCLAAAAPALGVAVQAV